jgi:hypothetical protein
MRFLFERYLDIADAQSILLWVSCFVLSTHLMKMSDAHVCLVAVEIFHSRKVSTGRSMNTFTSPTFFITFKLHQIHA